MPAPFLKRLLSLLLVLWWAGFFAEDAQAFIKSGYGPLPGQSVLRWSQTGATGTTATFAAALNWQGQRVDASGYYWLGARIYDPVGGKFLAPDPAGQDGSMDLYSYAGGDPINFADPTGAAMKSIYGNLVPGANVPMPTEEQIRDFQMVADAPTVAEWKVDQVIQGFEGIAGLMASGGIGLITGGLGDVVEGGLLAGGEVVLEGGAVAGGEAAAGGEVAAGALEQGEFGFVGETVGRAPVEFGASGQLNLAGMAEEAGAPAAAVESPAQMTLNLGEEGAESAAGTTTQGELGLGGEGGAPAAESVSINPAAIRFSQSSVNGVQDISASMRANGWQGAPIDVVQMSDGSLTTFDNTRVLAAQQAGIDVQAVVRGADEAFPAGRWTPKSGIQPATWQDAVQARIQQQNSLFRQTYPNGSPFTGSSQ